MFYSLRSKWIENGWDDFNDCASENYEYYEKVVVRVKWTL